jgi:predicted ATPase
VTAIYGPNASGKSNVLDAMSMMRHAVLSSVIWASMTDMFRRTPFLLDTTSPAEPSVFEVEIAVDGVRYRYGFEMDDQRIQAEWLYAYPKGRKQVWFERNAEADPQFRFPGEGLRGARADLVEQTRPDALFLTVAAQFNNPQLAVVHDWFRHNLRLSTSQDNLSAREAIAWNWLKADSRFRRRVEDLLRVADVGIVGLELVDEGIRPRSSIGIRLVHRAADRDISLELERESHGTRSWLALLPPLLVALDRGAVVLVDELDASLHPRMVAEIVGMFASPRSNPRGAQVVFSTHDATLLGNLPADRLLDRDEVWLTEKNKDGATELYPLTALKPRKDENLERGYLLGRYGAVPRLVTGQLAREVESGVSEATA